MDATQETQESQTGGAFSPQGPSPGGGAASGGGEGGGPAYAPGAGASGAGAAPVMSHFGEGGAGGGGGAQLGGGGGGSPVGPGWNFDAAWSGLGGGGGKKRGAPLAETLAMGSKAPKGKFSDAPTVGDKKGEESAGKTSGDPSSDKAGDKTAPKPGADKSGGHAKDDDQKGGTAPKAGEKSELPAEVKAAFPGGDLENVAVYLHSPEAAKKGVKGFANINEIHVAPGADEKTVLKHEAAHVIQFRKGRDNLAKGQKPDAKADNEKHAEAAEKSGQTEAKDLGSADPDAVRYSGEGGGSDTGGNSTNANSSGVPKVTFNGTQFDSLQGEFSGDLAKAKWGKTSLFQKEMWWRIPAFPAAGVYVKASGQFEPSASIGWKGSYSYSASSRKFTIGGSISGSLSAALTFALEGGAGINLVLQRGGVGLEAAATLSASASASRSISAWIDTDGNCGLDVVPIEVDFGAVLKAALSLVLWTDGWFYSDKWKWTFAEWTIATLAQYKANISVGLSSKDGVKTNIGPVQEGVFTWGQAPPADQGNGQKQ